MLTYAGVGDDKLVRACADVCSRSRMLTYAGTSATTSLCVHTLTYADADGCSRMLTYAHVRRHVGDDELVRVIFSTSVCGLKVLVYAALRS
jgi:hypothetical protein